VLTFCCALIGLLSTYAQDVITKNDGSTILSKVVSISDSEISYKSSSNINGPTYIVSKSDINYITYSNGTTEYFGSRLAVNDYGATTYTDAQLINIYNSLHKNSPNYYNKRAIVGGLIIFGVCTVAGAIPTITGGYNISDFWHPYFPLGGVALGATWYFIWKNKANQAKRQESYISAAPVFEQNILTCSNANLTAGMDVLSDCQSSGKALGFGVRLNF
jgi:hypothetical protein